MNLVFLWGSFSARNAQSVLVPAANHLRKWEGISFLLGTSLYLLAFIPLILFAMLCGLWSGDVSVWKLAWCSFEDWALSGNKLSKLVYDHFYTSLRASNKLLELFSSACEIVLGGQAVPQFHTWRASILPGVEAYPVCFWTRDKHSKADNEILLVE